MEHRPGRESEAVQEAGRPAPRVRRPADKRGTRHADPLTYRAQRATVNTGSPFAPGDVLELLDVTVTIGDVVDVGTLIAQAGARVTVTGTLSADVALMLTRPAGGPPMTARRFQADLARDARTIPARVGAVLAGIVVADLVGVLVLAVLR